MANKFFAIFFVFCVAANASVAVLQARQSNIAYAERISSNISAFTECKRYGINDENGLLRVAASNPEIFVILDVSTAQNYAKLVRDGQNLAPHITICDAPFSEEDALLLAKHGIVCILSASSVWLTQGLTDNAIDVRNVGFIYGRDAKLFAESEILQLKFGGFTVFRKLISDDILPDKFARLIRDFFENDVSIYRFCGNDPILPFFSQEPSMVSFVGQRAAAVVVDSPELAGMFRQFGVVMLKNDDLLVERISTFIVLAALFESDFSKPRFNRPIKIYCKNAVLYDKTNPYGKNIIALDSIFSQLDKVQDELQKASQTADAFWEVYANLLGNVIDTAAFSQKKLNFAFWESEIIAFFERTPVALETMVYIFIAIITLAGGLAFFRFKKSYKKQIALIIPKTLGKEPIFGDIKTVSLKTLLEKDNYAVKYCASLKNLRNIFKRSFPNLLVADWDGARVMFQLFCQEFANSGKQSKTTVILFNVPAEKHIQIKKILEGTNAFCFEKIASVEEFNAALKDTPSPVSYSEESYISGIIQEDNLAAVFQMIDGNRHTGCLSIECGKQNFAVYFKNGRAVYANDNLGESTIETIYNALNCSKGNFYFHLNKNPTNETFNYGADEILMGLAQRRDEQNGK